MTHNETRVSNDMRRAQAEVVPEERLKHMANSPARIMQGSAPVSLRSGELRGMAEEILASRQALLAHPLPNPSPSDGEVSEADIEAAAKNIYDEGPSIGGDCECGWAEQTAQYKQKARMVARAALQSSKRGQP